MNYKQKEKYDLIKKVKYAIKNNEFKILYQPKFNIDTLEVVGVEALIRWETSNGEIIYPDKFIPILEESKYIYLIDYYVLEKCMIQIERWINNNFNLVPIAINISKSTLMRSDFIIRLKQLISLYRIKNNIIEFEITEREELENNTSIIGKKVLEIKKLGIKVALDDFGVGNSNFLAMLSIDFDYIKIDKSILNYIENKKARNILVGIKDITDKNEVYLVAEGVENKYQYKKLKDYGYKYVQGNYFSKPITLNELENRYL